MSLITFLDFAEDDYALFIESVERGSVRNRLGALSSEICEKYMKHLIDLYYVPQNAEDKTLKELILREHDLADLYQFVSEYVGVEYSELARDSMDEINDFYISTRYPGNFSFQLNKKDIEDCAITVELCRRETFGLIENLEKEKNKNLDDKIEDARKSGAIQMDGNYVGVEVPER